MGKSISPAATALTRVFQHPFRAGSTPQRPVSQKTKGALRPLKIKKNDGFHPSLSRGRPSAIFLDFFTPASSPESAEVHARWSLRLNLKAEERAKQ